MDKTMNDLLTKIVDAAFWAEAITDAEHDVAMGYLISEEE